MSNVLSEVFDQPISSATESSSHKLPQYQTINTSDDSDIEYIEPQPKRRRGKAKAYQFIETTETLEQARTIINSSTEPKWVYVKKNESEDGTKINYSCSYKECSAAAYIHCHSTNLKATIYISDDQHDHQQKSRGISPRTKDHINRLYDQGVTLLQAFGKLSDTH